MNALRDVLQRLCTAIDQADDGAVSPRRLGKKGRKHGVLHLRRDIREEARECQQERVGGEPREQTSRTVCGFVFIASDLMAVDGSGPISDVRDRPRKALVHVILVMAMEKRVAGIIGHRVDFRRAIAWHADRVLHDARG